MEIIGILEACLNPFKVAILLLTKMDLKLREMDPKSNQLALVT
jgi:hypothetical protein